MRRTFRALAALIAASVVIIGQTGTAPAQRRLEAMLSWSIPAPPARIAGPIHFVGSNGLASYLIETSDGLILIDGGMPGTAHHVEASIRQLGFDPKKIKWLLLTHAHIDHAGATAHLQTVSRTNAAKPNTGARIAVMAQDVRHAESGGATDPVYHNVPLTYFPAFKVDRPLKKRDSVTVGGITLIAHRGAGHSPGATTWAATIPIGGKNYRVLFPCCTGVNPSVGPLPGHRLLEPNSSYRGIADDYLRTFKMLARQRPDIWLPAHTETFDFWGKRNRAAADGIDAWLDRRQEKYCKYLALEKLRFDKHLTREIRAAGLKRDDPQFRKFFDKNILGRCRDAPAEPASG
jgi:metallo-beta-lactamase class B